METPDPIAAITEALVQVADMLAPLREAVEGYRVQMEADGYDTATARRMAADYHGYLIAMLKSSLR